MASFFSQPSSPRWLLYCLISQISLALSQSVSILFIPETNTIIGINFPPEPSKDINFYITAPDWYQYAAIGFGSTMANSLLLVMYPSADRSTVAVSPRFTTGHTEPTYISNVRITLHPSSNISDSTGTFQMTANGTCHDCQLLPSGLKTVSQPLSATQEMIFAVGPGNASPLASNDLDARIRRHVGHGHFTINAPLATGPGGVGSPGNATTNAVFVNNSMSKSSNKAATVHGILFAIVALAIAPFDTLVAAFLQKWPKLHVFTSGTYFAFVLGAMVPGILISRDHILTQKMGTPHQALGLVTIILMFSIVIYGIVLGRMKKAVAATINFGGASAAPMNKTAILGKVHAWAGRLIWVLLLVNNGLGLKLSEQTTIFVLGYSVLAGGVFVFLIPIYFCLWYCTKARKGKPLDDDHELDNMPSIYDHERYNK
ncbi:hypothetical protein QBC35DRAFT_465342 [Podospora australis]|uniref:DOMON domain-containing protein n=1 Tax=Podospora australis TaxID=1536484 RepID=A0AAN7AH93_9PEZI|nr:hypothetical protein QBC35DRAFT_465342 [Podospora australis]